MPRSSKFLTKSTGEKIVKIGQYLAKIWTKYDSLLFFGPPCILKSTEVLRPLAESFKSNKECPERVMPKFLHQSLTDFQTAEVRIDLTQNRKQPLRWRDHRTRHTSV